MTPARRRHPALARKISQLGGPITRQQLSPNQKLLASLTQEIRETATARGHKNLITEYLTDTQTRLTCPYCGKDADANTNPPANGIDIGGSLVALNCEETQQ